ncbi:MAG: hypothetical protein AAF657_28530, partial [Acidobacteriota bacterium]
LQVLLWAGLFRLALLPAGLPPETWTQDLADDLSGREIAYRSFLLYDNDVWRYFWDGHVFGWGLDPYATSPAELEALADDEDPRASDLFAEPLWYDIYDRVSYGTYRTVYPPAVQWLFRFHHAASPGSVFAWKLLLVLFDLATCWLLASIVRRRGAAPELVAIYAWNPLVMKEIAGSGHLDAVMIFWLVLSVFALTYGWRRAALATYGLAILAKLTPLLLIGLYLRRTRPRDWWILPGIFGLGFAPFVASLPTLLDSLAIFSREWVFNPGPWLLLQQFGQAVLGPGAGRAVASLTTLLIAATLVAWTSARDDGSPEHLATGSFRILGGYLLFSAAAMPWYLLWVLPMAVLRSAGDPGRRQLPPEVLAWLVWTASSLLSYLIYIDQTEQGWWLWLEYLSVLAAFGFGLWRERRIRLS